MIDVPVHNTKGEQVDTLQLDEALLGSEVRYALLKQAFVRTHANQRQGSAKTKSRGETSYSTRKLYKQKGTGNARRGDRGANILRGGGMTFAKKPKSWRQNMPKKMRRLANRNALLAKIVDSEIKLVDSFGLDKPSTKDFASILSALEIDRSCLLAVAHSNGHAAKSAKNIDDVDVTVADRLCAFDLLNHRYLVIEKAVLEAWLERAKQQLESGHHGGRGSATSAGAAASAKESN
jgi:large subunit ribosomal protein L4